jgi:hypothetical protein
MLSRLNALSLLRCHSRSSFTPSLTHSSLPRIAALSLRHCSTNSNGKTDIKEGNGNKGNDSGKSGNGPSGKKGKSSSNEFKFTWKSFAIGALACVATGAYFEYQKRQKLEEGE